MTSITLAPLLLFLVGPSILYILMRVSVPDVKYNNLLLIGLFVIACEIVVLAWLVSVFNPIEADPATLIIVSLPIPIMIVMILDLSKTLAKIQEKKVHRM